MKDETSRTREATGQTKQSLRVRAQEFGVPPIHDALVLALEAPIGCVAIRKAIKLLAAGDFDHIEVEDDVIADVIIRSPLLRRMPREKFLAFIMRRIKPLMTRTEILHLDIELEITIEEEEL
ncbi:MAG: hypothetical protein ACE5FG_14840 [Myxococcota bacterium]